MFVVGITGGSGSGKTTVVERVLRALPAELVAFLPHDAYYRGRAALPEALRLADNWDHPDALDNALFVAHLDALRRGQAIQRPDYDFTHHSRRPTTVPVEPRPVLLVEGALLLAVPEVRQRIDLRVFVDTPDDLRLLRRVQRDVRERGRTVDSVAVQYTATVRPMYRAFIEPSRAHAHVILPWEEHNEPGVEVLVARLRAAAQTSQIR
jgi:uridine kinase